MSLIEPSTRKRIILYYDIIAKFQNLITDRNSASLLVDESHPATINRERLVIPIA